MFFRDRLGVCFIGGNKIKELLKGDIVKLRAMVCYEDGTSESAVTYWRCIIDGAKITRIGHSVFYKYSVLEALDIWENRDVKNCTFSLLKKYFLTDGAMQLPSNPWLELLFKFDRPISEYLGEFVNLSEKKRERT